MSPAAEMDMTDAQRDAAAEWLIRLDSGSADHAAFEVWLAADPRHAAAFAEASALWHQLRQPARQLAVRRQPQIMALLASRRGSWRRQPMAWGGSVLAACLVIAVLWVFAPALIRQGQNFSADAVTGLGERRQVMLVDGSSVLLAGNSAIAVSITDQSRQVRLLRGEAFFTIRPDRGRPFTVAGDDADTRVVGTRFNVRQIAGNTAVTVEEGLVDVIAHHTAQSVRLSAGQQVSLTHGVLQPSQQADLSRSLAWRDDRLVFYREHLSSVVQELERQQPGRIVIANRALADLAVSGVFPLSDGEGTLTALVDTLHLRAARLGPWLTVLY